MNANYAGSCVNLDIGKYPSSSYFKGIPNDSISSIKFGSSVFAKLCSGRHSPAHVRLTSDRRA